MFFFRMIFKALRRQAGKRFMIALTIFLGAGLTTSMLSVMLDVGDKIKQELGSYGANIQVLPQGKSVVSELYDFADTDSSENSQSGALQESELAKLKTIFFAYNIENFAPFLETKADYSSQDVAVLGTWFRKKLAIPTGEKVDTGMADMRDWWEVRGNWPQTADEVMVGAKLAQKNGWHLGDPITLKPSHGKTGLAPSQALTISGIFTAGSNEDWQIFADLGVAQSLSGRSGQVDRVEVRAITTPENDLSRRAARDPSSLSLDDWETWYCTAYTSSIAYQIEEVLSNAVARPVHQIADSEGIILEKTQLIMTLVAILAMAGSALGIANLVTASVMERATEIGLMKSLGARNLFVVLMILTETFIVSLVGAVFGCLGGIGLAQLVGHLVFGVSIAIRPVVFPLMAAIVGLTVLLGCLPSIRALVTLQPARVLHRK